MSSKEVAPNSSPNTPNLPHDPANGRTTDEFQKKNMVSEAPYQLKLVTNYFRPFPHTVSLEDPIHPPRGWNLNLKLPPILPAVHKLRLSSYICSSMPSINSRLKQNHADLQRNISNHKKYLSKIPFPNQTKLPAARLF